MAATVELITRWAEGLGGFFGLFAIWGAVRARFVRTLIAGEHVTAGSGQDENARPPRLRTLLTIYLVLYALVLVRHQVMLGYLSDRHLLPLVAVAMPWAAAGTYVCARRAAAALGWPARRTRLLGGVLVVLAVVTAIVMPQWKPGHRSRWGHWAAGCWLQAHARTPDAVLDTRGWASFVSNRPSYDYWHVRQALTDPYLAYIVVGADELSAASRRAATLRAVLAYSATPVAAFPDDRDGDEHRRPGVPVPTSSFLGRSAALSDRAAKPSWQRASDPDLRRLVLAPPRPGKPLDLDRRTVSRRAAGGPRATGDDPRKPRPVPRQAGPIDGAGRLPRGGRDRSRSI